MPIGVEPSGTHRFGFESSTGMTILSILMVEQSHGLLWVSMSLASL